MRRPLGKWNVPLRILGTAPSMSCAQMSEMAAHAAAACNLRRIHRPRLERRAAFGVGSGVTKTSKRWSLRRNIVCEIRIVVQYSRAIDVMRAEAAAASRGGGL